MKTIHAIVSGKVQGVWYRDSTKYTAETLGLTGWVRNLHSGEVELMATGAEQALSQLCDWLKQGPPLANVTHIQVSDVDYQSFSDFRKRSTK